MGASEMHFQQKEISFKVPRSPNETLLYYNLVKSIAYLLRQPAFALEITFTPMWLYNQTDTRIYGEMYTGNWWWREQVWLYLGYFKKDDGLTFRVC